MSQDHQHSGHHHHHATGDSIGLAFVLNLLFTLVEFAGGLLTNSAIIADAVHDLGDCLALGFAWLMQRASRRRADRDFTYGYHRLSLLGALVNGLVLLLGSVWVLGEALPRLVQPPMPDAQGMLWLALLGVAVNGYGAYRLSRGATLNEQVLSWHLLEDVLGWVAVLVVSLMLLFADWPILDPLLSILFSLFILYQVWKRFGQTLRLFLQAAPDNLIAEQARQRLLNLPHVSGVHHLHVWSLDGERHVLTAHLTLDQAVTGAIQRRVKEAASAAIDVYGFAHTTIELEQDHESCRDERQTGQRLESGRHRL